MIFICIIAFLILFLTLVMFLSVHFKIIYDEKLEIAIKILNFEFNFDGERKNKKAKKKVYNKKNELPQKSKSKNKNENDKKLSLQYILKLAKYLKDILFEIIRFSKFSNFIFLMKVANEDKMQTALNYGQVSAVLYPVVSLVNSLKPLNNYKVSVSPDFESSRSSLYTNIHVKIKIFHLVKCFLKIFIKIKNAGDFI